MNMNNKVTSSCADMRADARGRLIGNYKVPCIVTLIIFAIEIILSIPINYLNAIGTATGRIGIVYIAEGLMVLVAMLVFLVQAGLVHTCLKIWRGESTQTSDSMFAFGNRPGRFIGLFFLEVLISFACIFPGMFVMIYAAICALMPVFTLGVISFNTSIVMTMVLVGVLLLLAGVVILIIVMLSLAVVDILLVENPMMKTMDAFRLSRRMMKGNKWKYFKLLLSFIGWYILAALSFGVGLIWILPYVNETHVVFFEELVR